MTARASDPPRSQGYVRFALPPGPAPLPDRRCRPAPEAAPTGLGEPRGGGR
jgi:hypothetical protein